MTDFLAQVGNAALSGLATGNEKNETLVVVDDDGEIVDVMNNEQMEMLESNNEDFRRFRQSLRARKPKGVMGIARMAGGLVFGLVILVVTVAAVAGTWFFVKRKTAGGKGRTRLI